MKQILVTLAIACLAITGTTRADTWGRSIRNSFISQTQDKADAVQSPSNHSLANESPVIQAPSAISSAPTQYDGYPFTDRCAGNSGGCCSNVWSGYSRSCGCGLGHGIFGHCKHGCGLLHHGHGCGCKTSMCGSGCGLSLGGCFNSFGGGSCCNSCGSGASYGTGWQLGHKLHAGVGCGCGHLHRWGAHRSMCGVSCDTGCSTSCGSTTIGGGCTSCAGHVHQGGTYQNGKGQIVNPPVPTADPTPAVDALPAAPENAEKSAFRPSRSYSFQGRSGF